jgi:AcrR family transcriptional regulator
VATTRKLTPRGKERRDQLLTTATTLFAQKGYHPTSVADIVDQLGVGKGVFYWYFESKEVLFEEILREAQKALRRRQQQTISPQSDPVAQLELGIRAAVLWTAEHRELADLFDFAQTDQRFAKLIRHGRATLAGDAIPYLKEAIALGRIRPGNPEHMAVSILGVALTMTSVYIHQRGEDPTTVADEVVAFCLYGMGAEDVRG